MFSFLFFLLLFFAFCKWHTKIDFKVERAQWDHVNEQKNLLISYRVAAQKLKLPILNKNSTTRMQQMELPLNSKSDHYGSIHWSQCIVRNHIKGQGRPPKDLYRNWTGGHHTTCLKLFGFGGTPLHMSKYVQENLVSLLIAWNGYFLLSHKKALWITPENLLVFYCCFFWIHVLFLGSFFISEIYSFPAEATLSLSLYWPFCVAATKPQLNIEPSCLESLNIPFSASMLLA